MVLDAIEEAMVEARACAQTVRRTTSPNPWVGAVLLGASGARYLGATEPPGGRHAERVALDAAGSDAAGGTLIVTLEPCSHQGRTGPCVNAILDAGITTVAIGVSDPDPLVAGEGIRLLRQAGVTVIEGVGQAEVEEQLAPYLHHRRTGRPWVTLKMASTLDGQTAAADGSSKWITSEAARADAHELRADHDAILVGAGTVRADDPSLTARLTPPPARQPIRFVLGEIPEGAKVLPAESLFGDLGVILEELGRRGVVSLLVEGGARVAHDVMAQGFVNRIVSYVAPALMGGSDGKPLLEGPGAPSMEGLARGRFVSMRSVGDDLRLEVEI